MKVILFITYLSLVTLVVSCAMLNDMAYSHPTVGCSTATVCADGICKPVTICR